MQTTGNPYEAPQTLDSPSAPPTEAETIRRAHLGTEASIKSVGFLYYVGAIGLLLISVAMLLAAEEKSPIQITILLLGLGLGIGNFFVGSAIRKLKPWAKTAVGILSGIGLLGFPIGTVINLYILILFFGKKGQMVFSEPYQEIIAATPHVKRENSVFVWIALAIAVAVLGFAVFAVARS